MEELIAQDTPPRDLTQQQVPGRLAEVAAALCDLKLKMDRHARGLVG